MKSRSGVVLWCLTLCASGLLPAQDSAPAPQQSPAQQPGTVARVPLRVRVSRGVSQALIVKKVQPEYPQMARVAHIQGAVLLRITVSREGDVSQMIVISGHPLLAVAARDAVKQWKYKPYLLNGNPVEVDTEAVVDFSLESGEGHPGVAPPDTPPAAATGVVGDAPSGIPAGQTSGVIGGIISSTPVTVGKVATPQRVRVSQGVMQGLIVTKVAPTYPEKARKKRIQGTVVMHVIISKDGDIMQIDLVSGHPMLAPAAIEAVKQWKYKPYRLNEQAVEVDTEIVVNFTLAGD
jgi:TonB family protein